MARDNKAFVRNSIVIASFGLIIFIIALLVVGQFFIPSKESKEYIKEQLREEEEKIPLSENEILVVKDINQTEVKGYEVNGGKSITASLTASLKVSDAYGNPLPLSEIHKGDLIEIGYNETKDKVITLKECLEVQSYKKVTGVIVDKENKQIDISGVRYPYKDQLIILDKQNKPISLDEISPFDIINVQVYKETVWSIQQEEAVATLTFSDIPSLKGKLEIDYSRVISDEEIKKPINMIPGKHQVVVKLQGYESLVKSLELKGGEEYTLSLKEIKRAYTTLNPKINASKYQIHIQNKTYVAGETIRLPQDRYSVSVTAEGYEPWKGTLDLNDSVYLLKVSLVPIKKEEVENEENEVADEEANDEAQTSQSRTIDLSTDPSGAKVYIEGAYKGETPYTLTLPYGSYNILFEKQGYEVYATQILLDESNDQSSFLYALTKDE